MQLTFSCVPTVHKSIEKSLTSHRLGRYLGAATQDPNLALRLYVWNARLSEAQFLTIQLCEVALRNTIHDAVVAKFDSRWHSSQAFIRTLPLRLQNELSSVVIEKRIQYGLGMTENHVVAGLTFGFWLNLLRGNHDVLWQPSIRRFFPNAPPTMTRQNVYDAADRFRLFRNRVFHHKPIFDREPRKERQNMLDIIHIIDKNTAWFAKVTSTFERVLAARPQH